MLLLVLMAGSSVAVLLRTTAASSGDADDMNPWLVLVEAVEHDLAQPLGLVGQLHLGKVDLLALPVGPEVGAVRVDVDGVVGRWLRLAAGQPLTVDILPAVRLHLDKLEEDRVHRARLQPGDTNLE